MKDLYDIIQFVRANRATDEQLALATLIRAQGSSYRRPGARMLFSSNGEAVGSLSGGCLEEEVAGAAHQVMQTGRSRVLMFDTRKRFGCNGQIEIMIEKVRENLFQEVGRGLDARQDCILVTTAARTVVAAPNENVPAGCLVQRVRPPVRFMLVGEGPDSSALVQLAGTLGWLPVIADEHDICQIVADDRTAAIVKTHNYGRDFVALRALLPLDLPYVGLIGPRRRRDQLLNDLLDIGVPINAGFYAPAGLDLNAETPAEIALAIVSEIQRAFCGGGGGSLRDRKVPIHQTTATAPSPIWPELAR